MALHMARKIRLALDDSAADGAGQLRRFVALEMAFESLFCRVWGVAGTANVGWTIRHGQ